MQTIRSRTLWTLLVITIVACAPPSRSARADTPDQSAQEEEAKALIEEIKGLRKVKDSAKMRTALNRLVSLHDELSSKSVRSALLQVAGKVLSDKKMGADRVAAAEALGKINDPSGGYKRLKRSLPTTKTEAAGTAELAALRAVGRLAPDAAIPTLLDLMVKGKDNNVSKVAVDALGGFGLSKRRVVVLEEMAKYMLRAKPRYTRGKRVGAATRARWSAVGRSLVTSLNRLTGQKIRSADDWLEQYKAQKRTPKKLFLDEE